MVHMRQSRLDAGLGFRVNAWKVVPGLTPVKVRMSGVLDGGGSMTRRKSMQLIPPSSEYSSYKTVKARFWPWLSEQSPQHP